MGTEYSYYLGVQDANTKKIYPLGPYDKNGKILSIFSVCGSSSSRKFNDRFFRSIRRDDISDELNDAMDIFGGDKLKDFSDLELKTSLKIGGYYEIESIGHGNGMVSGYVNRNELNEYLKCKDQENDCYFDEDEYDILHEHVYAALSDEEKKNYVYFMWKDLRHPQCIARELVSMYEAFNYQLRDYNTKNNKELIPVVIMFYSY